MLARIRENLHFKLLALIVAIILHMYVSEQQNPTQPATLTVPLTYRNLPQGLMPPKPLSIMVTLTGPLDKVKNLTELNVTASVDLQNARPGMNPALPVRIDLSPPTLKSAVSCEARPSMLAVMVAERMRRRLPVFAVVNGASAAGYTAQPPSIVPSIATVIGAADSVKVVARLVVRPDVTGATDTVDDDYQIIPLDALGNDVPDVKISPDAAHVQIGIVETDRTREVFVSPAIVGSPAPGYVIGAVTITPPTLLIAGPMERLAGIGSVVTDPINIQGASSTITHKVHCTPPTGVTTTQHGDIAVSIAIAPAASRATPSSTGAAAGH
jgi:YbbR domain-containing protein